jgi:hypothetical protein
VVAERDRVGAGGEDLLGELRRESASVGRVLRVDNAGVGFQLLEQPGEPVLERATSRRSEDVGDEEDPQGIASAAAGWTSSDTWFPASCV